VKALFSVDIEWRRGKEVQQKALIQRLEFESLQRAISETSEESSEEFTLSGLLAAADVIRHTFRLEPDDGEEIRGTSGDVISEAHTVELPKRYTATVRKTTTIRYSTEQEDVSYELLGLEPIPSAFASTPAGRAAP
jgi:hypothetical protein